MEYGIITASIILVSAIAIALQVFFFSPISPEPLILPPSPPLFTPNNHLQGVIKIGEGIVKKPEDVCVDQKGMLYTATRDGWIKRLHTNGTWENWKKIHNKDTLLGLIITRVGDLVVCDTEEGLIKVGEDGEVTALATHLNGEKIRFADDVVEADDGSLYFSVASTKFELHNWHLDVLEAKPHGQLLKYDPSTKETSLVLDGLGFANGVTISSDQEFLVVCETWKFRCLKYWLKEEMGGKVDVFIDNLPGGPDNIKLAPDGSFWIAILPLTSSRMKFIHSSRAIKHLLATFPKLFEQVKVLDRSAMVINVGSDGRIIKRLDDPNGQVMAFVTSILEFEGNLYFGSLYNDFIGKLPIETAS
ncbi:protein STRICTOSIDINE SYNTHASE-LIKE 5-like [Cynara cardunculus var. scolymus]|uniref:protein STRICTOSIDINE SYNTHASE-LIKE 5-like n=1 Tax=Cynara cardunculus var. scolymus TaxID=59895 RepID=UPI000D62AC6B|nr:protein STRICTOSIDINE SYNTHASE-LIKE 5-like [Cynara cardunculus var. scolymus]